MKKVLFVNPIIYTPENAAIPKVPHIYNTMSYDLCRAFQAQGMEITLAAAEEWRPTEITTYEFPIYWMKSSFKKVFPIHRIPVNLGLYRYIREHDFDYIFTSEVFSIDSLLTVMAARKKTVVWHEMAMHQRMGHGMVSRFWYNVLGRTVFRHVPVVARSEEARRFISQYCKNVSDTIIEHGVDLDTFQLAQQKENCFCVISQLIERKRIDGIIRSFAAYVRKYDADCKLYIIGDGEKRSELEALSRELGMQASILFMGQMDHSELCGILARSKAMLVNTARDNSMISIAESIASGTAVVTTNVPLNAPVIRESGLGIAKDSWNEDDLHAVDLHLTEYTQACVAYRVKLSARYKAECFEKVFDSLKR